MKRWQKSDLVLCCCNSTFRSFSHYDKCLATSRIKINKTVAYRPYHKNDSQNNIALIRLWSTIFRSRFYLNVPRAPMNRAFVVNKRNLSTIFTIKNVFINTPLLSLQLDTCIHSSGLNELLLINIIASSLTFR